MNSPYFSTSDNGVVEGFPLSPQQASQWHLQQNCGARAVPHACLWLAIDTPVDPARLRASLAQLVTRHEILRTGYQQLAGLAQPLQVIAPSADILWLETGRDGPGVMMETLPDGRLRVCLRLGDHQADATSLIILARQWAQLYQNETADQDTLQYADYAAWRGELLAEAASPHALWEPLRQQGLGRQVLPLRRHADATKMVQASFACPMPPATQARWKAYAEATSRSPEVVLLAAWLTLCYQHGGSERLTMGVDMQQRSAETAEAVGLYAQALPLSMERLRELNFADLCAQIEQQCELLAHWRDTYPADLFNEPFALGFRSVALSMGALPAAGWQLERVSTAAAGFQILLECSDAGLCWHVNAVVYDEAAIAILSGQLVTLLDHACSAPELPLTELVASSEQEQSLIVQELSHSLALTADQVARYDAINSLDSLAHCFSQQVATHADMPAVQGPSGVLSYRELDRRSTELAHTIRAHGVQPGSRVVHMLPRDLDAVVAMLAIFKAGACYVPVDPAYPAQRVEYILNDCQAQLVLTHSTMVGMLTPALRARAMTVDALPPLPAQPEPARCNHRKDGAYLIYTSGSTGQPKGVPISHANCLHSLAARVAYYPDPVRKFLLLSSFAFDSSIAGLFWTLAQGGTLVICSQDDQKDPARLARMIAEHSITHMLALPTLHALLLEHSATAPAALSTVIVAGEACPPELVRTHLRSWPAARLYNEYGPTEASVWSSVAECTDAAIDGPVPIGRAIPGSQVLVLDDAGSPCARGMLGEIHIAGPGLSSGYANAQFDADKFVTSRHPLLSGQRLYRSGDRGYLTQNGALMFAGRADAQVKVRGYRIELGEIESALRDASGALLAVALADGSADPVLRAFIEAPQQIDLAALRAALALRLPDYMIPADIQVLPSLPRSANGKVDGKALLALRANFQRPPFAAPVSTVECALAGLWQQLLGCPAPGMDDDFFALGGHSLLVVRLVHLIKASLDTVIPVGTVFRHPTIRALAAALELPAGTDAPLTLRSGDADQTPVFLLHRPAGDVQHYAALVAALPGGVPAYGLILPHGVGPEQASLHQLARRYLEQMQRLQPRGPYLICGWSMGGLLALEIAHLIEQQGEKVGMLAVIDSSFDVQDQGLSDADLLQLVSEELDDASCQRLAASDSARAAMMQLDPANGKMAQLRYVFGEWAAAYGMTTTSSPAIVQATLYALDHARRWVANYVPPIVHAELDLWWAQATLVRQPGLQKCWTQRSASATRHTVIEGDHDDILERSTFISSFVAALSAATSSNRDHVQ